MEAVHTLVSNASIHIPTALLLALDWARANCPTERISICSDSQFLLKAIQGGAHDTQSIRQRLDNREGPTTLNWVPSLRVRCARRSRKHSNTGCRDAQISMSAGNTHLVVLRPHSESDPEKVLALARATF